MGTVDRVCRVGYLGDAVDAKVDGSGLRLASSCVPRDACSRAGRLESHSHTRIVVAVVAVNIRSAARGNLPSLRASMLRLIESTLGAAEARPSRATSLKDTRNRADSGSHPKKRRRRDERSSDRLSNGARGHQRLVRVVIHEKDDAREGA